MKKDDLIFTVLDYLYDELGIDIVPYKLTPTEIEIFDDFINIYFEKNYTNIDTVFKISISKMYGKPHIAIEVQNYLYDEEQNNGIYVKIPISENKYHTLRELILATMQDLDQNLDDDNNNK